MVQLSTVLHNLDRLSGRMASLSLGSDLVYEQLKRIVTNLSEADEAVEIASVLRQLSFPSIAERFGTIIDSAPSTFQWLFDDPDKHLHKEVGLKISFTDWLRRGSGIFHLSGKPGAGKSALLKFIAEHEKLEQLLDEWVGTRNVISANFFLMETWNRGSEELTRLGSGAALFRNSAGARLG
jgi:hypothetical protein